MDRYTKLLSLINFDHPSMAHAKALKDQDQTDACVAEIIRHFRTRENPKYLFTMDDLRRNTDREGLLADAQEILDRKIYGYQFEGDIDWHFNPTDGILNTAHDNEWSWSLYRFIFWQPLARAYALTGDERYPAEALYQLKGFLKAWPLEDMLRDEDAYIEKHKYPHYPWRHIETAMRLYTAFIPCMTAFRESPTFDADAWSIFLGTVCDHADYLVSHYSNHNKSSNWLTMETGALLQTAIMYPELKHADEWFKHGYQRVMHEMRYSFDNDGVHMERTPIYHMVAAISYMQCNRLCELNNIPIAPYAQETITRACEFIMRQIKPDFSNPMIGDADRNDLCDRRSDTSVYEGMNLSMDPFDLNEMRAFFRLMYEQTGREDFLWFATGRQQGHAPEERNYSMKEAGIHIMRTGWEADDSYFHIHGVQLERGEVSTHSHNDQCHFELQIKGEDILLDGGRYIYNQSIWKNWRHYFLSACAHNTLYMDDLTMGAVPGVTRTRGVRTFLHRFEENDQYAVIDVSHNGYVFTDDPVYHRRLAIRLEDDVYVLDDRITGLGLSEHDFRLFFNFAPGQLTGEGDQWTYQTAKGTAYQFAAIHDKPMDAVMLHGSEDPIGGWVSYGYSLRTPAPQLQLRTKGPAPFRNVTVIAPRDYQISGTIHGDEAVVTLCGPKQITLTLKGEDIIRQ